MSVLWLRVCLSLSDTSHPLVHPDDESLSSVSLASTSCDTVWVCSFPVSVHVCVPTVATHAFAHVCLGASKVALSHLGQKCMWPVHTHDIHSVNTDLQRST